MLDQFICYGSGSAFHWVEEVLERRMGAKIVAIIDRRHEQISADFNCPVWDPGAINDLQLHAKTWGHLPVVLALGDPQVCRSVEEFLRRIGFQRVISLNEIYEAHLGFQLEDKSSEALQAQLVQEQRVIENSRSLLADAESQVVFDQIVSVYVRQQGSWINAMPAAECHFPAGINEFIDYSCIVLCGVAADELQLLLKQSTHAIQELICFEPDPNELHGYGGQCGLIENSYERSEVNYQTRLEIHPMAVHSKANRRAFWSSGMNLNHGVRKAPHRTAFGSRLSDHGQYIVETIDIDTALHDRIPTFMAIDAEGAELEILIGASATIETNRPTLMIAVYHRMNHLWQVIDYLHERFSNYRFFLRNYTGFAYETFVYAIPAERWIYK
jgi:FkbM family methyltransferase